MKITVLQAVYKNDNPLYLSECLKSLHSQTFSASSILIVKDGELTPNLNNIIKQWECKLPIKAIGYEENQGLAHALNYGLQFVNTELVARMDSDDVCLPNRFEKEIQYFENHPDAEIVGSSISEFYKTSSDNDFSRIRLYPEITTNKSKTLFKGTPLAHPTVMMKTNLLKKYQYNENTNMNEDIDLWFRILSDGVVIHTIQEPLLNFRITDSTFKRRSIKKAFSEFHIYFSNLLHFFGFSLLFVYPLARLISRMLPYKINKKLYFSKTRENMFSNKGENK